MRVYPAPVEAVAAEVSEIDGRLAVSVTLAPTPAPAWYSAFTEHTAEAFDRETVIEGASLVVAGKAIEIRTPAEHLEAVLDWIVNPAIDHANEVLAETVTDSADPDDELAEPREILDAWLAERHRRDD